MANTTMITQDSVHAAFFDGFRLYAGQGRKYSLADISEATGIPLRTIRAYHGRESMPSVHNLLLLMTILPPEFGNRIARLVGKSLVDLDGGPDGCLFDIQSTAGTFNATMGMALSDNGRVDHDERPALDRLAEDLNAQTAAYLKSRQKV